jgi:hypothetical protein
MTSSDCDDSMSHISSVLSSDDNEDDGHIIINLQSPIWQDSNTNINNGPCEKHE